MQCDKMKESECKKDPAGKLPGKRREGRAFVKKKKFAFMLPVSILVVVLLAATVFICVRRTSEKMTQYSFDELTDATKKVAQQFYDATQTDNIILKAMAELLAGQMDEGQDAQLQVMNSFDIKTSFISTIALLTPDEQLLFQDGTVLDASGKLDFETEAAKGNYVSNREPGIRDPDDYVLRSGVPVEKNGRTVAMLYGVASLKELSETYTVTLYGGKAFVLGVDGTTGDIMLDTWHNTLGNLEDLNDRQLLMGFSFEELRENLQNGIGGDLSSMSHKIGKPVYLHYEPVGINNWSICLGVSADTALAKTADCTKDLFWMAAIIGVVLVAYMALVTGVLVSANRRVYQASVTDESTQLRNRSAYETYLSRCRTDLFGTVSCIYIDANGLHELNNRKGHAAGDAMLRAVADQLREKFPRAGLYRIGGDEFVVFPKELDAVGCTERMQQVVRALKQQDYSVSFGVASREQERGLDALVQEADERMLENKKAYYAEKERRAPR